MSGFYFFSFWRQKEKGNKKKKRRLKTEAGILGLAVALRLWAKSQCLSLFVARIKCFSAFRS